MQYKGPLFIAWAEMLRRTLREEAKHWAAPGDVDRLVRRVDRDLRQRFGSSWVFRCSIKDVRAGVQRYFTDSYVVH
jgi:hypothetical protein